MSITNEIGRINEAKQRAYASCQNKGATLPDQLSIDNLGSTIESIPSGGGAPEYEFPVETFSGRAITNMNAGDKVAGLSAVNITDSTFYEEVCFESDQYSLIKLSLDGNTMCFLRNSAPFIVARKRAVNGTWFDVPFDTFVITTPASAVGIDTSPDGKFIVCSNATTSPYIIMFKYDEVTHTYKKMTNPVALPSVTTSPIDIVTFEATGNYVYYRIAGGMEIGCYKVDETRFTRVSISATLSATTVDSNMFVPSFDGRFIASGMGAVPIINLFQIASNGTLTRLNFPTGIIRCYFAAFTHDNIKLVAYNSSTRSLWVYTLGESSIVFEKQIALNVPTDITALANKIYITKDDRYAILCFSGNATNGRKIKIFDIETGGDVTSQTIDAMYNIDPNSAGNLCYNKNDIYPIRGSHIYNYRFLTENQIKPILDVKATVSYAIKGIGYAKHNATAGSMTEMDMIFKDGE